MPDDLQQFHIDYVYGPMVGRRYIEGTTLKEAEAALWDELERIMWVADRFRSIQEVKD